MPFCDVSKDIKKINKFIEENDGIFSNKVKVDEFNKHLLSCTYMEIASFFGFLNVLLGYYLNKYTRDALCYMQKEEETNIEGNEDTIQKQRKYMSFKLRDKITRVERSDFCHWLQFINNLSSGACPTTAAEKPENQNPYARLLMKNLWAPPC